ncbi:MAG: bifunctional (p)ppGpp synthetase/guanosine-3',5'-bis(diphosphate) 3'-pyrophosphohydrolase [bacterium]|nr:bifunctional (p)ppGpp synthetase/guanosine-3',5'-bis(diphosphate) 3'-pyrophosphohydrolase [bacterium]MDD6225652.1 bifunctional (p)ppGpp synthetase/guanosine-3',5'-bis(diphosphate) 3'-pyrophosphohydrolase [bacterium]
MSRFSNVAHYQDYNQLKELIEKSNQNIDMDKVEKAYRLAEEAHGDQRRLSGIPYILHPTSVACILVELGMDTDSIIAALLHDVVEDTHYTLEEIEEMFGKSVANLVDGVTKISKIPYSNREEQQAENIRKMLIAMSNDIRVIIIKLADRLHNMRTIECMPEQKRRDKSLENMEVFAPIAHRLGIKRVKEELEDLSLLYLDPVGYKEIEDALQLRESERDRFIEDIKKKILDAIGDSIKGVYISGRVKSINSIYRKTFMQGKTFDQIFDVFAVRVIVDTVRDCYNVLGIIHDIFQPIPNRFKDYISTPKSNMYQSLHTTVIGKDGIPFEVQIRTWEMHNTAEYGIAAHWKYKLGVTEASNEKSVKIDKSIEDLKEYLKAQIETEDATDLIKNIKNDFGQSDVFVFTPKGDVFTLPMGSTTIDLAYLIHTEIGHRMVGAKVNNKIVPIDYKLKTGEIVEIITQKDAHPNRDWLDICKTSGAKSKIRQWFKREKRDENIAQGKAELERELKRNGIHFTEEESKEFFKSMLQKKHCNTMDDFYAAIGYGGIQLWKMMPRIKEEYQKIYAKDIEKIIPVSQAPKKRSKANSGVIIEGVDDVLVKFSQCCNPLPGDDIIGYITRGYGVSIHSRNCTNVPKDINNCEEPERWINAYWEDDIKETFRSTLEILANDRTGFLADVTIQLSNMHIFIHSLNSREVGDGKALITATIDVNGINHLKGVISKLSDISGIISITRK